MKYEFLCSCIIISQERKYKEFDEISIKAINLLKRHEFEFSGNLACKDDTILPI